RRRRIQTQYNLEHGITPATVRRAILDINPASGQSDYYAIPKGPPVTAATKGKKAAVDQVEEIAERIEALRQQMFAAAENLQFETAARLRDEIAKLQAEIASPAAPAPVAKGRTSSGRRRR